jgi:hypothetical protein
MPKAAASAATTAAAAKRSKMRASPLPRQETGTLAIGVTERIAEISGFLQLTMTGLDVRVRQFAVIFNKLGHDHKTAPTPGGAAIRYSLRPVGQRIQVNAGLRRGTHLQFRPLKNILRHQIGRRQFLA